MPDQKGPKIELPDELVSELDDPKQTPADDAPAEAEAAPEPAGGGPEEAEAAPEAPDLERELEELKDKYLRLAAEFENFRRRALKERQELLNYSTENLVKELLPTVDNLERALGHASLDEEGVDKENLREGVELTFRSLMQTLEKGGVQIVAPEGEPFDPKVHEAIRQVPSSDYPAGTVVEVYQKGFLLKKRLLRPALVGVASEAESGSDD